jgi:uncharacterized Fe-S cluster-containing protein
LFLMLFNINSRILKERFAQTKDTFARCENDREMGLVARMYIIQQSDDQDTINYLNDLSRDEARKKNARQVKKEERANSVIDLTSEDLVISAIPTEA